MRWRLFSWCMHEIPSLTEIAGTPKNSIVPNLPSTLVGKLGKALWASPKPATLEHLHWPPRIDKVRNRPTSTSCQGERMRLWMVWSQE